MSEEMCRLCGNKYDSKDLTLLFCQFGVADHVLMKIEKVLQIIINEKDPLPKNVCMACSYRLDNAYNFIISCHNVQKHLNNLFNGGAELQNSNSSELTEFEESMEFTLKHEKTEITCESNIQIDDVDPLADYVAPESYLVEHILPPSQPEENVWSSEIEIHEEACVNENISGNLGTDGNNSDSISLTIENDNSSDSDYVPNEDECDDDPEMKNDLKLDIQNTKKMYRAILPKPSAKNQTPQTPKEINQSILPAHRNKEIKYKPILPKLQPVISISEDTRKPWHLRKRKPKLKLEPIPKPEPVPKPMTIAKRQLMIDIESMYPKILPKPISQGPAAQDAGMVHQPIMPNKRCIQKRLLRSRPTKIRKM